eukprot:704174-Hanusia_phi.AAC.2
MPTSISDRLFITTVVIASARSFLSLSSANLTYYADVQPAPHDSFKFKTADLPSPSYRLQGG